MRILVGTTDQGSTVDDAKTQNFVSPRMISMCLNHIVEGFHISHIAHTRMEVRKGQAESAPVTDSSSGRRNYSKDRKKSIDMSFYQPQQQQPNPGTKHIRPFAFMNYIYTDLQQQASLNSPFNNLHKLVLSCVILDEHMLNDISYLQNLETITLEFVKMRVGGLFSICSHCKSEGNKLSEMFYCKSCNSSSVHIKECTVLSRTSAYTDTYRKISASSRAKKSTENYLHEDISDSERESGVEESISDKRKKKRASSAASSNMSRSAWIDGEFLAIFLRSCSRSLTSLSVTYVLPSDPDISEDFVASFQKISLFESLSELDSLHIREVHEGFISNYPDQDMAKSIRHSVRKMNAIKAFSSRNVLDIAVNCPSKNKCLITV
jgi:hypothetical protein